MSAATGQVDGSASDPKQSHYAPYGWGKLGLYVKCPHQSFGADPIVFSFENCEGGQQGGVCKRFRSQMYAFEVLYVPSHEYYDRDLISAAVERLEADTHVLPDPGAPWLAKGQVEPTVACAMILMSVHVRTIPYSLLIIQRRST